MAYVGIPKDAQLVKYEITGCRSIGSLSVEFKSVPK